MTTQVTTQQVLTQAMVNVMTVSVFYSAMGVAMAAVGFVPSELPATDEKILNDLRRAFGADVVDKAVERAAGGGLEAVLYNIEGIYIDKMKTKYGVWQTTTALESAPPGDLRAANLIAATLAGQGVTPSSSPLKKEVAINTGKAKGKQAAKAVKDTKTGIFYKSESAAGKAVAAEYPGLDPGNTFVWYQIKKLDPTRFVPA